MLALSRTRTARRVRPGAAGGGHGGAGCVGARQLPGLRAEWEKHEQRVSRTVPVDSGCPSRRRLAGRRRPEAHPGAERGRQQGLRGHPHRGQGGHPAGDGAGRGRRPGPPSCGAGAHAQGRRPAEGEDRGLHCGRPGLRSEQALDTVPDAVRFTLTYSSDRYAEGVLSDVDRLKSEGFELIKLKNLWAEEQYKGINSQWRQAGNGAALRDAVPHAGEPRGEGTNA